MKQLLIGTDWLGASRAKNALCGECALTVEGVKMPARPHPRWEQECSSSGDSGISFIATSADLGPSPPFSCENMEAQEIMEENALQSPCPDLLQALLCMQLEESDRWEPTLSVVIDLAVDK